MALHVYILLNALLQDLRVLAKVPMDALILAYVSKMLHALNSYIKILV